MMRAPILLLFVLTSALACADDLTTRDGKVYHGYKIVGHDAGFVTIMYSDGGGKIPLSQLPDDLQQKYGYNKAQADAFVQASTTQERQDRHALALEEQQQHAALAAARTPASPTTVAPSVNPTTPPPPASASAPPSGLSAADVASINAKIADLQRDIQSVKTDKEKGADPRTTTLADVDNTEASDARIQNDEDQINKLQAQLGGGQTAAAAATTEDVATIRQKITDVKQEIAFYRRTRGTNKDTNGAYNDKIIEDEEELKKLSAELQVAEHR